MNVETGAEQLGKTQVGLAPTPHATYLLARSRRLADFITLMKPRVMALAVFTAMVGMIAAPGRIDPLLSIVAVLAIAAGAGASGVLNMWYDADIDAVMVRTAMRPIPRGRILHVEALVFGLMLAVGAVVALAIATNIAAAALLAGTILFYVVVYTAWLKRHTRQNIVIGGAAGALPPVIGWAAASGEIGFEPLALFLIIFLWTPPHFWALAGASADAAGRCGQGRNNAADPCLQRASDCCLHGAVGARLCRSDLCRDRRNLRNDFSHARAPAKPKWRGRSACSSSLVRILNLLPVRRIRSSLRRTWRPALVTQAALTRGSDHRCIPAR